MQQVAGLGTATRRHGLRDRHIETHEHIRGGLSCLVTHGKLVVHGVCAFITHFGIGGFKQKLRCTCVAALAKVTDSLGRGLGNQ